MKTRLEIKDVPERMETVLINSVGDTFTISHLDNRNEELLDFLRGFDKIN